MDWNTPAPGELALVQRFINTAELDVGTDELADADGLAAWLREAGLADARFDEATSWDSILDAERDAYAAYLDSFEEGNQ